MLRDGLMLLPDCFTAKRHQLRCRYWLFTLWW